MVFRHLKWTLRLLPHSVRLEISVYLKFFYYKVTLLLVSHPTTHLGKWTISVATCQILPKFETWDTTSNEENIWWTIFDYLIFLYKLWLIGQTNGNLDCGSAPPSLFMSFTFFMTSCLGEHWPISWYWDNYCQISTHTKTYVMYLTN